jgi:hypothetical protein
MPLIKAHFIILLDFYTPWEDQLTYQLRHQQLHNTDGFIG